jgi:hypothetical protein
VICDRISKLACTPLICQLRASFLQFYPLQFGLLNAFPLSLIYISCSPVMIGSKCWCSLCPNQNISPIAPSYIGTRHECSWRDCWCPPDTGRGSYRPDLHCLRCEGNRQYVSLLLPGQVELMNGWSCCHGHRCEGEDRRYSRKCSWREVWT